MGTFGQPGEYSVGAISPNGRRYVVPVTGRTGGRALVMIDIERNITSEFTSDPAVEENPLWTTDGESVVFSSTRKGVADLDVKNAGGASPEQVLYESTEGKSATGYSSDSASPWTPVPSAFCWSCRRPHRVRCLQRR